MRGVAGPDKAVAKKWQVKERPVGFAVNRKGTWGALTLANGDVSLLRMEDRELGEITTFAAHDGVSLSLSADTEDHAFLSGGDDGKLLLLDPALKVPTLIKDHSGAQGGAWIDHVASNADGLRAYSVGKNLHILSEEGEALGAPHLHPSAIGGLAFSPNGKRLAAAHYGGITLWWAFSPEGEEQHLPCKGSHLAPLWHPDGKMILTSMQENALHGWCLEERDAKKREMHMAGYAAKIHAAGFTAKAKYLATSGMDQVVCWPFFGGGPWEKAPMMLGGTDGRLVTQVAPHPRDEMLAAGYDDGMIILAPFDGRMEVMLSPPLRLPGMDGTTETAIMGLAWNEEGDGLYAVREDGEILLFTLASISRSVRAG